MLKGYMARERLGTTDLDKRESMAEIEVREL